MSDSIVYTGYYDGVCMYVGEGKPDRWKHLNSGTSHVYEANKHHFEGKTLKVDIVCEGLSKAEATRTEKALILELKPAWNKVKWSDSGKVLMKEKIREVFGRNPDKNKQRQISWLTFFAEHMRDGVATVTPALFNQFFSDVRVLSAIANRTGVGYEDVRKIVDIEHVDRRFYRITLLDYDLSQR